MKNYTQMLVSLIVGGFVIILVADIVRQIMGYLIVFAFLAVIFRILFRDRL
jgi:hypothetical protein